jgi:tRNA threonylcarbamoyladenosine biosynthesis protein TsaB
MLRLAFDTSTEFLSIAVAAGRRGAAFHERVGHKHAERILPVAHELAGLAGGTLRDVGAIAFGAGPGAFTGLRIACGVAQGLGLAFGLRLVPIDAFTAIAEECRRADPAACRVLVAIDARMSELYVAALAWADERWSFVQAPHLARPDALVAPEGADWIGAGSGFAMDAAVARFGRPVRPQVTPRASTMLGLVDAYVGAGRDVDAADAAPLYLRDQVALTVAERARAAAAAAAAGAGS